MAKMFLSGAFFCYNDSMIILQANKIERSFSGQVLFQNINLQIDQRDRIALVGPNGAGKSTLLKILVGEEAPTSGEINKKKDMSLSYLAQDSRFESSKTIYEEMLAVFADLRQDEAKLRQMEMEMGQLTGQDLEKLMKTYDQLTESFRLRNGFSYESDIKAILNGFKFDESMWTMPIESLSGGQNTRLALAKMLLERPDLLVLDEPTNHLDIETIAWLENYLTNYQGALLIVSHDRYFLDKVATVTFDLRPNGIDRYVGNYSQFVDLKAVKIASEEKNYEKQQKEIAKLEDFVQKNIVRASTTKRAQARRKQLAKIERLDKPTASKKSANMTFQSEKPSGNQVLMVEEAAIGYDNEVLSEPIEMEVKKYDAIAIVGPNGIGKSTLIKSIIQQIPFIKGQVKYGANVTMGYYDQTQSRLSPSNTVLDELWNDFPTTPELDIRNRLGAFLFSGEDVKKTVGMLSGGERARLLLAKLSMENNNFLILDEPTNHLDIDSKEVLENALIDYDGTLVFVSHDRYFINRVASKVLEITETGSSLFLGDYDYYVEKKAELAELAALTQPEEESQQDQLESANDYQKQKENQKEVRKLTRRLQEVEARLEEIEASQAAINEKMFQINDPSQLIDSQKELDQLEEEQMMLMEEWEEIGTQLDI
ncbi:ABC-F family ATP-binding cassette domain-containing protein [Streptococcus penaeicida]